MRTHLIGGLAAATLMMGFSADADARPFRPGLLPNGDVNTCANCHVSPAGGGARTAFGEDVRANVSIGGMEFFWADVCNLDSDGDGQTNGEELGDPCCIWDNTGTDPSRMMAVSLPGDMTDISTDPTGPDDDGDGMPNACDPDYVPPQMDMGMGGDDMGGDDMGMGGMDMATGNNAPGNNTPNNTPGNNDPGNNDPGNNDPGNNEPGADMGGSVDGGDEDGGCGCTSAPTTTATPWLLAFGFVFARLRRRR